MGSFLPTGLLSLALITSSAYAGVVFDLRDRAATNPGGSTIEDLDEQQSFDLVRGGVTATLASNVDGVPDGQLNQTSGGFGVNASGSNVDETDQLDGDNGLESILVRFETDVVLLAIDVSEFCASDQASLRIGDNTPISLDSAGFEHRPGGVLLPAGLTFELKYIAGSGIAGGGFSLDSFEVATVPEPGAIALFGAFVAAPLVRRRRVTCN